MKVQFSGLSAEDNAFYHQQEMASNIVPIWLIEEPESYLHPELSKACQVLLAHLAEKSLVVLTTHALAFVPTEISQVQGVDLEPATGRTRVSAFASHQQATRRIRESLGVQFADYYNLGLTNIFVEGPSDRRLILWASATLAARSDENRFPTIDGSLIEDFGGVKQLEGFLRGVFEPLRAERALVAVFDGDSAGVKSRQALQQYFGAKDIQFQPNREFVSVRSGFAIEGLFPDAWIVDLHAEHPGWFDTYSLDSSGQLEPFRIKDNHKSGVVDALIARAEGAETLSWAGRWVDFLGVIEISLARQRDELQLRHVSSTPLAAEDRSED